jgi:WD40 repeat protein
VAAARFSPDGRIAATGSFDRRARLWRLTPSGTLVPGDQPVELLHDAQVVAVQFSPDGRWIVTGSYDYTARLWKVTASDPRPFILRHEDIVTDAEFSRDGRLVVTASRDGAARVWSVQSGHPITEPLRHRGLVAQAAFLPAGASLITASADRTARVWTLPQVTETDSSWLGDLAEFVARRRILADGESQGLNLLEFEELRSRLDGRRDKAAWVDGFLH